MTINGKAVDLQELKFDSLYELIRHYELDPETIAVEMNDTIPDRSGWENIRLRNEDRIELIRFVGGG